MEIQTIPPTVEEYREGRRQLLRRWYTESGAARVATDAEIADLMKEAVAVHGVRHPRFPECEACLRQSVFPEGPTHVGSSMCRSGGRPHCSCDACF